MFVVMLAAQITAVGIVLFVFVGTPLTRPGVLFLLAMVTYHGLSENCVRVTPGVQSRQNDGP